MVNLPKPTALTSSADLQILPRASLASQLPAPSTPTCCYQFGLTTLPQQAQASLDSDANSILSRLLTLSQLLAIPTLFARGDGQAWTHSEQHYPALLQWREQHVPALLAQVEQLLSELAGSHIPPAGSQSLELVLGHTVSAVARYLPPHSVGVDSQPSRTRQASPEDGWTSNASQSKARDILATLQSDRTQLPAPSTLATALLADYIKPIFHETTASSAPTSAVNPVTGRRNPPAAGSLFISHLDAHLGQHRFGSADEDNDAADLAPRRFALRSDVGEGMEEVGERNEALGCVNVLAWCLDVLRLESEADWSAVWPLIVPPLLTLLEHPQPRFRLRGSVVVHWLLRRPGREQGVLGTMLVRTGIGSLLERALHVNLTYIHDELYAPALLEQSIGALRQLILLTTAPIVYRDAAPSTDVPSTDGPEDDCGQRRMDALFRLVSEGVLSTWSYLPLPPASTQLGRDLTTVTCSAYITLAHDLAPPSPAHARLGGTARFLDVSLDWLFRSWLAHVAFDHTDQLEPTLAVLALAQRLLADDASAATRRFTGLILSSVAKCWICAVESCLRSSGLGWDGLERGLSALLVRVSQLDPSVEARWSQLVRLDKRLDVLLPSH
ncbi:uncharacterized protein SRS1_12535 [Sporisorium reilianum f. sp. reilianum]|uniref:Uncharacterized protein n=1 Tax=Sporisorium reilianum f. sp. reilianum TaxID=72559 RepID=A0A2N8UA03_9BASI|nr:uncharacterized protein SRS1_12535 [Sporisorium reilianum f. sp. reilianum]